MKNKKYEPGDWVTIKYGEFAGCYGKVLMLEKSGSYMVVPYDEHDEPKAMKPFAYDALEIIEPYRLTLKEFKELIKGKVFYSSISEGIFPPFNIHVERKYKLSAKDIVSALKNINETDTPLSTFKEWFWMIINVFYEKLYIEERYDETGLTDYPQNEDELFSDVFGLTEKLYWRLEERFSKKEDSSKFAVCFEDEPDWNVNALNDDELEKAAYLTVCSDIISRVDIYYKNLKEPDSEPEYSLSQKKIYVNSCEEKGLKELSDEEIEKYISFVMELAAEDDLQAIRILAWSYYEGSEAFEQNWKLSEKWLLKLYDNYGDPFAANSLGYIYYYGRVNDGHPEYEKAFKYFSFGALSGIDESIYKCGDMLISGNGTTKSIDMGINMIVEGYRATLDDFCFGEYDSKFADYALRMGNICRDKLIYGMGLKDAYKFYLEARYAIKKRRSVTTYYGDKTVEATIDREIEKIQDRMMLDLNRKTLRADFPIYINQLFEDIFPLKVSLTSHGNDEYLLKVSRFRFGADIAKDIPIPERFKEIPKILVCYPELSHVDLVSELSFILEEAIIGKLPEKGDYFLADGFRKNDMTNALEFFSNGELIAAVEAKWYTIDISEKNKL